MMNEKGMTLVELMVSLVVMLIIVAAAGSGYLKLMGGFNVQGKIAESYMEKLTGLELLRFDIEMAGYGLFHNPPLPPPPGGFAYQEADEPDSVSGLHNPEVFNDAPGGVPRAFVAAEDNTGLGGSDVMVIKSSIASYNDTTSKWAYIYENAGAGELRSWGGSMDFKNSDRFIALDSNEKPTTGDSTPFKRLKLNSSNQWYFDPGSNMPVPPNSHNYIAYGIGTTATTPRMPFNRVDYYLGDFPTYRPSRCYDGTYTLYRSNIVNDSANGGRRKGWELNPKAPEPLFDCVMDFQVIYWMDNGNMLIEAGEGKGYLGAATPEEIRNQLREVRVYILYHEGGRDESYTASQISIEDEFHDPPKIYDPSTFGPGATHYRWQLARIVVKPNNLR